jgi:hypothetical protein
MQIPILNGIFTDNTPELRTSYPVNLMPVPKVSGISNGFLRPGDGIVANGTGPGVDRGGINWNGDVYRVMGTKLVEISSNGAVTILGDVGSGGLVTFDYSFDELAVTSGGNIYFWNGTTLTQGSYPLVTIGPIIDFCFIDGRFMLTDGERLFLTDIGNPLVIGAFAFEEPIADPDPVTSLLRLRNEVYAINRFTMEVYDNLGTAVPFPFGVIQGAQVQKGCVGVQACCVYLDQIAFLGSGRNEAPGIYTAASATTQKISTQEIDNILLDFTEAQLSLVKIEARNDKNHEHLYVHLPNQTLVYDASASQALQTPVWFILVSTLTGLAQYRARNMVWAYDKWLVGDPQSNSIGYLVQDIGSHWGQQVYWEFGTLIVYNESNGAIFNELELVSLTGSVALGKNPQISTSYSLDGKSYSQEKFISVGTIGNTKKRLAWFQQGHMRNWRIQRFKGDSDAHVSFLRLEAQIEPLAY